jgi:hypothetical protein
MAVTERESIKRMQEAIRRQRAEIGLSQEGATDPRQLLTTLKKEPPIAKLVQFIKASLRTKP